MEENTDYNPGRAPAEEDCSRLKTVGRFPFFSLVIPVYNTAGYLEDCIRSVLKQSFPDFEVLVIDDGSTDESGMLCDRLAMTDGRIRVFHNENQGLLATRIWGNVRCRGQFIVSLDSDDGLREDALEVLHRVILEQGADLVIFGASRKPDFSELRSNEPHLEDGVVLPKEALYKAVCDGTGLDSMALKTFRRDYAPDPSATLAFSYVKNGEDLLQSISVITRAEKPVYVKQSLYYYRINESSMNRAFQRDYARSMFCVGEVLLQYAMRWDLETEKAFPSDLPNQKQEGDTELSASSANDVGIHRWRDRMMEKNLHTCAKVVRYYALRAGEAAINYLKEIRREPFFMQTCSQVQHDCLDWKERIWLDLVEAERWKTLKAAMAVRSLRHMKKNS